MAFYNLFKLLVLLFIIMEPGYTALKLYAVGSAEISQFCIPLPEGQKQKPSTARKPLCLSTIKLFDVIEDPEAEEVQVKRIPNPLLKEKIVTVACGGVHTLLLTKSQKVYSFGSNDEGALGRKGEETVPALVQLQQPVNMITAGDCHSMFANTQEDLLYFCGLYRGIVKGHIADKVSVPQQIPLNQINPSKKIKEITKIISGYNHSMILADGTVFIRGDSEYFALGRKILDRHKEKVKATTWLAMGLKKVQNIWTGGMHCFASVQGRNKGVEYYGWGNNAFGQLGLGKKGIQSIPQKISFFEDMNIIKIAGGQHHSLFLNDQGELYTCGKNDDGQLGLGDNIEQSEEEEEAGTDHVTTPQKVSLENVTDIASGPHFSYAITNRGDDNQLYSWGLSSGYVLINGSQDNDKNEPYNVLKKILNYQKIVEISAGGQHVMYLAEPNNNPPPTEPPAAVSIPTKSEIAPKIQQHTTTSKPTPAETIPKQTKPLLNGKSQQTSSSAPKLQQLINSAPLPPTNPNLI